VLAGVPARIVSLVPSLTETLASWGIEPVGATDWCVSPELPDAVRVRGTKNPDVPLVISLAPDLVVADQEENRKVDVERLRAAGIPVYVTAPRSLAQVADSLERLGTVVGVEDRGRSLAEEIRSAIASPPPARRRVFCPVWRDPWIAVGTDTIAADLLHHAGLDVVTREPRYPRVELDEVRSLRPEVVLLPSEPYEFGEADVAAFDGWAAAVHLVDGQQLTWWGPRTPGAVAAFRALSYT
jgi:ABC-type Fe3+-hydroxamate transport system substrate-binding protein